MIAFNKSSALSAVLPSDIDAKVTAQMFIRICTFEIFGPGIDVPFFSFLIVFYIVLNFLGHKSPPLVVLALFVFHLDK